MEKIKQIECLNQTFNKAFFIWIIKIILQNKSNWRFKDISHGLWEGKLENEIKKQWPELQNWHEKPEEVDAKGEMY